MPITPAPRSLPPDVHWNRQQTDPNCNAPNREEHIPHALSGHPVVEILRQTESEHILDEVHRAECLACLVSVAVYNVGHDSGCAELDSEVDQAEADDDRNLPGVLGIGRLTPCEKSSGREDEVGDHDWESELRFKCTIILLGHSSH